MSITDKTPFCSDCPTVQNCAMSGCRRERPKASDHDLVFAGKIAALEREAKEIKTADAISPKHYKGAIACWDYAIANGLDFLEGNVVKYVTRWRKKGGIEDLKKARAYLDKLIETAENKPKT